jgi:hypothetical protein
VDGYSVVIDLSGDEIFFVFTGEGQLYAFPLRCQDLQGNSTLKNHTSLEFISGGLRGKQHVIR